MITSGFPIALSIRQPWAWLIVNGHKDLENRDWPTKFRGRVLIHTGKKYDDGFTTDARGWPWAFIDPPQHFDLGGIIGEAEIVDCITASSSPWFQGPYAFVLRNAKPLPFVPYRGKLGFFEVEMML
ncbi:ASCH domain-containing protein [Acidocella sp.]|uniref:ASCH domain-containing protein n=1 Tax=Acidocella sp. TaxID=50710 RepID=UPI0026052AF8|nr:ASCH domain-containing protein [Acidocella sp.]MDD2794393.1 ASCH domain-containing protein [Acidocella sp.]